MGGNAPMRLRAFPALGSHFPASLFLFAVMRAAAFMRGFSEDGDKLRHD